MKGCNCGLHNRLYIHRQAFCYNYHFDFNLWHAKLQWKPCELCGKIISLDQFNGENFHNKSLWWTISLAMMLLVYNQHSIKYSHPLRNKVQQNHSIYNEKAMKSRECEYHSRLMKYLINKICFECLKNIINNVKTPWKYVVIDWLIYENIFVDRDAVQRSSPCVFQWSMSFGFEEISSAFCWACEVNISKLQVIISRESFKYCLSLCLT